MSAPLIGKWVSVDLPCYSYHFQEGGKGFYSMWEAKKSFTWIDHSSCVEVHFENDLQSSLFDYSINGDTLAISDSFGNTVIYKKE